jgi:hypothetical protein
MASPVGPRGLTVLVIVGIAGLLLAILGWTQRGTADTGTGAPHSAWIGVYLISGGTAR